MKEDLTPCGIERCSFDARGTNNGSPPPLCRPEWGIKDPRCRLLWLGLKPQGFPTYGEFLAWLEERRSPPG